jgi:hypothetical protein
VSDQDQAKRIAERVARKFASASGGAPVQQSPANSGNRTTSEPPRARVIDFISSGPPIRSTPSVGPSHSTKKNSVGDVSKPATEYFQFVPVTQSPWHGRLPAMLANENPHSVDHPSQQRFGVEEATVAELVEFFENEKKCAMDPSGKPCDHCAMCSSRGF